MMFAKPERAKNTARIDGISALVNALSRAMVAVEETQHQLELW